MANREQFEYNRKSKKELKHISNFYWQLYYDDLKRWEQLSNRFDQEN